MTLGHEAQTDSFKSSTNVITDAAPLGPFVGPTMAPDPTLEEAEREGSQSPPLSPYSAQRAAIRKVTLPPIPDFNIPPSPPGSPSQATTAKFERFFELKRQGIHFNEKLERSSALRNPGLFQKLMGYAGISEEDQYCSTLPAEIAVPTKFPDWASPEELAKAQQRATMRREEELVKAQRSSVEFVPASGLARGSAAERVMAGLDKTSSYNRSDTSRAGERRERDGKGGRPSNFAHR